MGLAIQWLYFVVIFTVTSATVFGFVFKQTQLNKIQEILMILNKNAHTDARVER